VGLCPNYPPGWGKSEACFFRPAIIRPDQSWFSHIEEKQEHFAGRVYRFYLFSTLLTFLRWEFILKAVDRWGFTGLLCRSDIISGRELIGERLIMPSLYAIQGPDKGHTFDMPRGDCAIGRGHVEVRLSDTTVSREHARVFIHESRLHIEDLGSSNGTYVNGVRIGKPLEIKQGDHVRVGKSILVFSEDEPIELPPDETEFGSMIDLDLEGQMVDSSIVAAIPADGDMLLGPAEVTQADKHLKVLYDLVTASSSVFNIDQLLHTVMDRIFREIPVDHGFILLRSDSTDRLEPAVIKYRQPGQAKKITTSNTIIEHAVRRREAVLCTNAMADRRFRKGQSVHGYGLQSVICAPIISRETIFGVIHIDCSISDATYDSRQLHLLKAIGYQTGLAMNGIYLYQDAIKAERLAATGQTVAALSHYIRNILQGLQGGADTVERGLREDSVKTIELGWNLVNRNLNKIQSLMLNMLAYSKEREPRLEPTQVNVTIKDVLELTRKSADDKGVMLITDLEPHMPAIPADPDGLHQVVLNIVTNALDAVAANTGAVTIRTRFNEQSQEAVITVGDNGPGLDEDQLGHIFELFHSTKGHGGTGLGLPVAKKIVDEHHGALDVTSHPGEGAVFTVRLPVDRPQRGHHERSSTGMGATTR